MTWPMTWHPSGPVWPPVGLPVQPCLATPIWPPVWPPCPAPSGPPSSHPVWPPPSGHPRLATPSGHPVRPPSGRKNKIKFLLVVVAGWKRGQKIFQFLVFNPQVPRAPRASRAKPREEEGFFGLVPLITHPSSIPLLGGLTPKFLSLSFHSL
jgi:hypothetical protein